MLAPTFVYLEDNLGGKAENLYLCGFGAQTDEAERRFAEELGVAVEAVRSPLGRARRKQRRLARAICDPSPETIEMRIPINLASQPFRRDRPMLLASAVVSARAEDLERVKTQLIAEAIYAQDNQAALARWYGGALTTGLSIEDIRSWPDRIRAVTAEQVRAAAQKWLDKKRSVTGYLIKDTSAKREEKRS